MIGIPEQQQNDMKRENDVEKASISRYNVVSVAVGLMAVGQACGASANAETPQKAKPESLQAWRGACFEMFIHWGPVSLKGTEISWSRANSDPQCVPTQRGLRQLHVARLRGHFGRPDVRFHHRRGRGHGSD
jgi:hypothetical protein